jgi:hypothetical protein
VVRRQAVSGQATAPTSSPFEVTALAARSAPGLTVGCPLPRLRQLPTRPAPKFFPGQHAYKSTCVVSNTFPLLPELAVSGKPLPPHFSPVLRRRSLNSPAPPPFVGPTLRFSSTTARGSSPNHRRPPCASSPSRNRFVGGEFPPPSSPPHSGAPPTGPPCLASARGRRDPFLEDVLRFPPPRAARWQHIHVSYHFSNLKVIITYRVSLNMIYTSSFILLFFSIFYL